MLGGLSRKPVDVINPVLRKILTSQFARKFTGSRCGSRGETMGHHELHVGLRNTEHTIEAFRRASPLRRNCNLSGAADDGGVRSPMNKIIRALNDIKAALLGTEVHFYHSVHT